MWFFRLKNKVINTQKATRVCPFCGSMKTSLIHNHGLGSPNYVKVWRGQRSVTCRCLDCGRDFYSQEMPGLSTNDDGDENDLIDDEEDLKAAEEEMKKQIQAEKMRRWL